MSRVYHYAESTTLSTTTSSSDQTKVTLTFQPDADSQYVYIWSAQVQSSNTSDDVRVNLRTGSTVLAAGNLEDKDVTDFHPVSGLASETFGASPSSVTLTLNYSAESGNTAEIREARILALKLETGDVYAENTSDQTTTSTSFSTALTLSWTPASAGDYILLGSAEYRFGSEGEVITRFVHNSTNYGVTTSRPKDPTNYHPGLHAVYLTNLSGSQSATVEWARSATTASTAYCRRARLLALRADGFPAVEQAASRTRQTTTSTTLQQAVTTGTVTVVAEPYLILGVGVRDHNSTTSSAFTGLQQDMTILMSETVQEATVASTSIDVPAGMWAQTIVLTPSAGSTSFRVMYSSEAFGTSTGISDAAIFAIQLQGPVSVDVPVTGVAATGAVGQVLVPQDANVPVTGVEATGAVGTVTVVADVPTNVPVTGVEATGAVGTVTVVADANVPVTGVEATGAVGTVIVLIEGDAVALVTGVSATGATGQVAVSTSTEVPVTGTAATGAVGTVAVSGAASIAAIGVEATGEVGSAVVDIGERVFPTGVSATGQVGTLGVSSDTTFALVGVFATGQVGTAQGLAGATAPVSGVFATGAAGQVVVSTGQIVLLSGVFATGRVGQVAVWGPVSPDPGNLWTETDPSAINTWNEVVPNPGTSWTPTAA
jgi:hypothetical protein